MPLIMSRPWKHPKTGIYQLRRAVPEDLRALVGKREEKVSLQTRDPAEAKQRFATALAELEVRWANLRAGPKPLAESEAHHLAVAEHNSWLKTYSDNPSQQNRWDVRLGDWLFGARGSAPLLEPGSFRSDSSQEWLKIRLMEQECLETAKRYLATHGIHDDWLNQQTMARAVGAAIQRACLTLLKLARGETLPQFAFSLTRLPAGPPASQAPLQVTSFQDLLDGWKAERRPVAKTIYEWSRVVRELEKYLGHTDARRLTSENLVDWKRALVTAGLRAKTIQGAKLSPVRAILQWGVQNKLLSSNAAEGISLDVKAKQGERKRSFTDEEAKVVLRAALAEQDPVKRWVPWIGAYTGARLSEICQLRREDVLKIEDVWCVKFVPEAGSLKTSGSERIVPVHPALIESGLLGFVAQVKSGPLFAELSPDKFGKRGGNGTKMIGRFVRQLGLKDPRLSPSHSWRHRIKTLGRKHGLAQDILNSITGHRSTSVADSYGEFPVEALFRELCKIPALELT
ncbi:integrase [Bradyrhizobium diazoefficiens]